MQLIPVPMLIIALVVAFKFIQVISAFQLADNLLNNPGKQHTASIQNARANKAARELVWLIVFAFIGCTAVVIYGCSQLNTAVCL